MISVSAGSAFHSHHKSWLRIPRKKYFSEKLKQKLRNDFRKNLAASERERLRNHRENRPGGLCASFHGTLGQVSGKNICSEGNNA